MSKSKLTNDDFCRASKKLNCEVAAIKSFGVVESKGEGFDEHDRPTVLFEHAQFHKFTGGVYDKSHSDISSRRKGHYGTAAKQWGRFQEACALNRHAAILSTSFGRFQCMGFNYALVGYANVEAFYKAMYESESKHLDAFVEYCIATHLGPALRSHDWNHLAAAYNGPDYRTNDYQIKLPANYAKFAKEKIDCSQVSEQEETHSAASDPAIDQPATQSSPIIDTTATQTSVPPTTTVTITAPAAAGTMKKTLWAVALAWLYTAFGTITDAIDKLVRGGYVDAKEVGGYMLSFLASLPGELAKLVSGNKTLLLVSLGVIAAVLIYRDLKKRITFWISMYTIARPDMNNVMVTPEADPGHPWWAFWR